PSSRLLTIRAPSHARTALRDPQAARPALVPVSVPQLRVRVPQEFLATRASPARALGSEHDLQHTAVALWIASGANMLEVSSRAGHASTTFPLDRYGHLSPDADEAVADRLSGLFVTGPLSPTAPIARIHGASEQPG